MGYVEEAAAVDSGTAQAVRCFAIVKHIEQDRAGALLRPVQSLPLDKEQYFRIGEEYALSAEEAKSHRFQFGDLVFYDRASQGKLRELKNVHKCFARSLGVSGKYKVYLLSRHMPLAGFEATLHPDLAKAAPGVHFLQLQWHRTDGHFIIRRVFGDVDSELLQRKWKGRLLEYLDDELGLRSMIALVERGGLRQLGVCTRGEYLRERLSMACANGIKALVEAPAQLSQAGIAIDEMLAEDAGFSTLSYSLWLAGVREDCPVPRSQAEVNVWKCFVATAAPSTLLHLVRKMLTETPNERQTKETFGFLLLGGFGIDEENLEPLLEVFALAPADRFGIEVSEAHFHGDTRLLVELWQAGVVGAVRDDIIVEWAEGKSEDAILHVIERLPATDTYRLGKRLGLRRAAQNGLLWKVVCDLAASCWPLVLDIESDGHNLREVAWRWKGETCKPACDSAVATLSDLVAESDCILIGHNLKEFDLPTLQRHGFECNEKRVLDTLELELFLAPERLSHALRTAHDAASDVGITEQLLYSQLLRLAMLPDEEVAWITPLLPGAVAAVVAAIKEAVGGDELLADALMQDAERFFHSAARNPTLPKPIAEAFSRASAEGLSIILPSLFWSAIPKELPVAFLSASGDPARWILDKEKIHDLVDVNAWIRAALLRFADTCESERRLPYVYTLGPYFHTALGAQGAGVCVAVQELEERFPDIVYCASPNALEALPAYRRKALLIAEDAAIIESCICIGRVPVQQLFDGLGEQPLWMRFCSGASFHPIALTDCIALGLTPPDGAQKLWIERTGQDFFEAYAYLDFEHELQRTSTTVIERIEWSSGESVIGNTIALRGDDGSRGESLWRVNPESFYRQLYWTYCAKLVESITGTSPIVLLVQRPSEIEALSGYFRQLGFFVPRHEAGLPRKLELLKSSGRKALLPVAADKLEQVLQFSADRPISFVLESFNLSRAAFCFDEKEAIPREDYGDNGARTVASVDSDQETPDGIEDLPVQADIFNAVKASLHEIRHWQELLFENNSSHLLYLLDPRLADYPSLEKNLNATSKRVKLWRDDVEYKAALEIASKFFAAHKTTNDFDIPLERSLHILRDIFLDCTQNHQWREEQRKYFEQILPGKKHMLVTLPTGGGKSLLFQGPALLRNAVLGRLSLVITPLKALIEDQVNNLWNLGFFSSVDFISGDRPRFEQKNALRKIAGGETALLYITPERFRSKAFLAALATRMMANGGCLEYFVFDEAHCISQWGQEFRPDYLHAFQRAQSLLVARPEALKLLLFSATISEQVFADITRSIQRVDQLEGRSAGSYNPVRDHICMRFETCEKDEARLDNLIANLNKSGFNPEYSRAIIFTGTRREAEEASMGLQERLAELAFAQHKGLRYQIGCYHAGMDAVSREEVYNSYRATDNSMPIIFATKAFGMGIDIGNIHHLYHFLPPSTFEDYLQEVGRAARNAEARVRAGFEAGKPIEANTIYTTRDFGKLRTRLRKGRLSWPNVGSALASISDYLKRLGITRPGPDKYYPIPFNLATEDNTNFKERDIEDNKFRLALHWLEKLNRIKLGLFTPTHIRVSFTQDFKLALPDHLAKCATQARISASVANESGEPTLLSLGALGSSLGLNPSQALEQLRELHKVGALRIEQEIAAVPTRQRMDEFAAADARRDSSELIGIKWLFAVARKILGSVEQYDERSLEADELESIATSALLDLWKREPESDAESKHYQEYRKDLLTKRLKHVFTLLAMIPDVRSRSKITGVVESMGGRRKSTVVQLVYNGAKTAAWKAWLDKMEANCDKTCLAVFRNLSLSPIGKLTWVEFLNKHLPLCKVTDFEDILLLLRSMGYLKTSGPLLPSGIEVQVIDTAPLQENDAHHDDFKVYEEFKTVSKVRELKLIAMEAMVELPQEKQDEYIRAYFAAKSYSEILSLIEKTLGANHKSLRAFREEALEEEEKKLSPEQRRVYNAPTEQHISVIAGPGSGKTHTLMLRVARLIQKEHIDPSDILVLAYNRAVVSELKTRLQKLFRALGYEDITRPLLISTFHELALRVHPELRDQEFDSWEPQFLTTLRESPHQVLNAIGNVKYLLVDEFQDATRLRIEVLERLVGLSNGKLFAIGDPNQSIYGYEKQKLGDSIEPKWYYDLLDEKFSPTKYFLSRNFRSLPSIVARNNNIIKDSLARFGMPLLSTERVPSSHLPEEYCTVKRQASGAHWIADLKALLQEKSEDGKPYQQIAVLFRTNDEVFRGWERIQHTGIKGVRIRIQGSQPVPFERFRECFHFLAQWEAHGNEKLPDDFADLVAKNVGDLRQNKPAWNSYYLSVIHALVLQFLDEEREPHERNYATLCDFVCNSTKRDDGQLWKVYQLYKAEVDPSNDEVELMLTTIHRVKGLEFDAVIVPPSFAELPFMAGGADATVRKELIEEERRLLYVAYSRAKYRLVAILHEREMCVFDRVEYVPGDEILRSIGRPLKNGLKDVRLYWGAQTPQLVQKTNSCVDTLRTGTPISVLPPGIVCLDQNNVVGRLSSTAAKQFSTNHVGFFVNEVIVRKFTDEQPPYDANWCPEAKQQGHIFVVTVAGFGRP